MRGCNAFDQPQSWHPLKHSVIDFTSDALTSAGLLWQELAQVSSTIVRLEL